MTLITWYDDEGLRNISAFERETEADLFADLFEANRRYGQEKATRDDDAPIMQDTPNGAFPRLSQN